MKSVGVQEIDINKNDDQLQLLFLESSRCDWLASAICDFKGNFNV